MAEYLFKKKLILIKFLKTVLQWQDPENLARPQDTDLRQKTPRRRTYIYRNGNDSFSY
jgi:hypothetical protein